MAESKKSDVSATKGAIGRFFPSSPLHWVGVIGLLAVLGFIGAWLVAWSGIYNIGASNKHSPLVYNFLQTAYTSSVAFHAQGVEDPPNLDDPSKVQRGATHYLEGCQFCHGGPGIEQRPLTDWMRPQPPYLMNNVQDWTDQELFWILQHGIGYSGMPAWTVRDRPDEVWAMVAFLRAMVDMDQAEYRQAVFGADMAPSKPAFEKQKRAYDTAKTMGFADGDLAELDSCARCHGYDGLGRESGAFPVLGIQTERYLENSLLAYKSKQRKSGIMHPVAADLSDEQITKLAQFYARTPEKAPTDPDVPEGVIEIGRKIATDGVPERAVPACTSCHGRLPEGDGQIYPQLKGQYANYIQYQLAAFANGGRGHVWQGDILDRDLIYSHILPEAEALAVGAFYASLGPTETIVEGRDRGDSASGGNAAGE